MLAEASGDALVIWDASRVVRIIVRSKMTDADADALLRRDAIRVLGNMLPNIDRTAKTVTVRVIYAKTGEVSPIYGTPTFKGVEHYAVLTADEHDLSADHRNWSQLQDSDTIPSWFVYKVTGRLPPRI